jgi:hypothetical protein
MNLIETIVIPQFFTNTDYLHSTNLDEGCFGSVSSTLARTRSGNVLAGRRMVIL